MKTCAYCGRENEENAAHCRECGTELGAEQRDSESESESASLDGYEDARAAGEKRMRSGAAWFIGGILVTMFTYVAATHSPTGGTFIVAWGAIAFGALRFFQGWDNRKSKPNKEEFLYEVLAGAAKMESMGRVEEALAVYQKIIEEYPDTDASADAKKSLESLKAKVG